MSNNTAGGERTMIRVLMPSGASTAFGEICRNPKLRVETLNPKSWYRIHVCWLVLVGVHSL